MSRNKSWTEENWRDWQQLRQTPAFQTLERIVTKGLSRIEPGDVEGLVEASPVINSSTNTTTFQAEIRNAVARIEPVDHRQALEALLRADPLFKSVSTQTAYELARVRLGEADGSLKRVAKRLGKSTEELSPFEKLEGLTTGSENFRRPPQAKRRPGEKFYLLRQLHDELVPAALDEGTSAVVDQPADAVTYAQGQKDVENVRQILQRQYQTDLELTRFAAIVIDDHRAVERMNMSVTLSDGPDDLFVSTVTRDFQARFDRYVVVVARGTPAHRTVMRQVPELRELIWLPIETNLDEAVPQLINNGMLMVREPRAETGYRPASFTELPPDDPIAARIVATSLSRDDYRLLQATVDAPNDLLHYRSKLAMRLPRQRRRFTWFADGPTYIDRVRIDLGGFEDSATSTNVAVQYFMPGTDLESGPQRYEREVHAWIVRHHGFTMTW